MYITMPGTMGYAGSWHYLDLTRRMVSKAKKLLATGIAEATEPEDVAPEQLKTLKKYTMTAVELVEIYMANSNTEFSMAELLVPYYVMLEDENFTAFVETYTKEAYETFNRVVATSSERSMQIRGPETLLAQFLNISDSLDAVIEELSSYSGNRPFAVQVVYPIDDLFVP